LNFIAIKRGEYVF